MHDVDNKIDDIFRNLTVEVIRTYNAFKACMEKNAEMTNNSDLKTLDCLILILIESNYVPKPASAINTAFNYESNFNVDYSIKKLIKLKLITKNYSVHKQQKKIVLYAATEKGQNSIRRYMKLRDENIITIIKSKHIKKHTKNAIEAAQALTKVRSFYQESLEIMCTHNLTKSI